MSKTRQEKIDNINARIAQLENQRKEEQQKQKAEERRIRDRRLYKRAGLFESLLPSSIALTDEQFNTFLIRTVANDYGLDKLAEIIAEGEKTAIQTPSQMPTPSNVESTVTHHQNAKSDIDDSPANPHATKGNDANTRAQTPQSRECGHKATSMLQ